MILWESWSESARFKAHDCVAGIPTIVLGNKTLRQSFPPKPAPGSTCIFCEPYPDLSKIDFYPCRTRSQIRQNFYKSWNAASYTQKICLPVCRIGSHQQHRDMIVKATSAITNSHLISTRQFKSRQQKFQNKLQAPSYAIRRLPAISW